MQSYDRVCVLKPHGCGSNIEIIVSKWWDYSNTTLKYVKQFLNSIGVCVDSKADITRKIKNGEIRLVDDIILS